jgi:peptidoglycan/xylan/chitin deacetylase (PgdA/CDA1 family)
MDLYFPKLWIRSSKDLLKNKITAEEWVLRMAAPLKRKIHRLEELMQFDAEHGIPSTFFFGMASGLGMSYTQKTALPLIHQVQKRGFAVGVHGIAYSDHNAMKKEHDDFAALTGAKDFGMRMHYVRFDNSTFKLLSSIGYLFDTSEFDKEKGYTLKAPYQIGDMWEFPLCIMDSYLPYDLDEAKRVTLDILGKLEKSSLKYLTILFHDAHFDAAYGTYRQWYMWIVSMLSESGYAFASYEHAVKNLAHPGNVIKGIA